MTTIQSGPITASFCERRAATAIKKGPKATVENREGKGGGGRIRDKDKKKKRNIFSVDGDRSSLGQIYRPRYIFFHDIARNIWRLTRSHLNFESFHSIRSIIKARRPIKSDRSSLKNRGSFSRESRAVEDIVPINRR